jgi:alkylation response protein AidB-like acyl-CoA dehydrogenase
LDFELDDGQQLLADSARRWAAERCEFTAWQAARRAGGALGDERWPEMASFGWSVMALPPAVGGIGAGPIECGVVAEALGAALVAEPFLQSGVIAATLIGALPPSAAREALAIRLSDGGARIVLAHTEASMIDDESPPVTRAWQRGETWLLDGAKCVVMGAPKAQMLIVSAQTDDGPALFNVAPDASGLAMHRYATVDAQSAADLTLNGVAASSFLGVADLPLARARDAALVAIGAEAIGLMDRLLHETQDYTRTRKQFGQALASFQVLRHRMVDMFMQLEAARSLVLLATIRLAERDADAPRALAAMKVKTGQAGRFIGQQAVQLHGGMGMTDDLAIGHAFKRLMALDARYGNADHHLRRLAALDAAATA